VTKFHNKMIDIAPIHKRIAN